MAQDVLTGVLEPYRDSIEAMLPEPAWSKIDDPIENVFALLASYRTMIVESECAYGFPIGSLALELNEPDPLVRALTREPCRTRKRTKATERPARQPNRPNSHLRSRRN